MAGKPRHVVVIGAGIVGVSTAIWLRRKNINVTLVDRHAPGREEATSFGNAGILAACSVVPVTTPGMVHKSPGMLLDRNFPLFLRWSYLPKLTPWLLKYLSHANDKDTRRISAGLAPLLQDAVAQHTALAKGTEAEKWLISSDYSFAYASRAAFEADHYVWNLRHSAGFVPEVIAGEAVRDFEPHLSPDLKLLAVMRDHGYVGDPSSYVHSLAQEAKKLGVTFVLAEVEDFIFSDERVSGIITSANTTKNRQIMCGEVVLATGVWSGVLTKKIGISVPIESERGYHIEFSSPEKGPATPIMVTTGKFVATPMRNGLRCAGVIEFGGVQAPSSRAPLALLQRKVKESFPRLHFETETHWLGHRPAPSDSLPLIGEIKKSGIFTAIGHHHIGLTSGPKTGRLLADMIVDHQASQDMSAYSPSRFIQ